MNDYTKDVQQKHGQIILLSTNTGPGSGKTTASEFLEDLIPGVVTTLSFASPLKAMLRELLYLWVGSSWEADADPGNRMAGDDRPQPLGEDGRPGDRTASASGAYRGL